MGKRHDVDLPQVPGIDLDYRPGSYFWALDANVRLPSGISGEARRKLYRARIEAGVNVRDGLDAELLDKPLREAWGRLDPCNMGGEYLPEMLDTEVEIARITIASVTQDVTSVFARRTKHRIRYRVVDEYEGGTLSGRTTRSSVRPLTLGELEVFFNGAWSIFDVLAMNFGWRSYDREQMQDFVVGVESEFYPQIGRLYDLRIEAWGAAQRAKLAAKVDCHA